MPFAVEERRLYMPLVGMCALVARAGFLAMSAGTVARTSVLLVTSMFAVALATSTVVYVMRRQDPYTLSLFQYQKEPKNPVYTRQLSEELIRKNQRSRALAILRRGYHDAEHRCDHFAEAELGLLAMTQLVHLTPDLNQAQLMSLRAAYDRLLVEGALHLHMSELELEIPKVHLQKVVVEDTARFVTLPRALAWTRTMELSAAEQQLLRLTAANPGNQDAWGLLALVYARQSKWTQLDRALGSIAQFANRDVALLDAIHRASRAKALAQTPVHGEVSTAIRDAQVQLILLAPEAARRLLDPAFQWTPTHRELVLTYAQTYIDDQRRDLAVQLIQRTQELDPRHADFWTQALATVRTLPPSL
jgi:predicted Zn-dependent protease